MPTSRAVLLLRRLSTGENKLKNLNINQNTTKETLVNHPIYIYKDLCIQKRLSTYGPNNLTGPLLTRGFSDNKIKRTSASMESPTTEQSKHTNKLISEKSPYLLQHAHNPVDWYPWGEEAFEKAKREDKLIFLSVGYSTCHWCHVMEKESFESGEIAKLMNEHFINIKVDREERPDIDRIYMLFIMATTRSGGWPMSVFLTPDLHPVTGGTYFPPSNQFGLPSFKTVLLTIAKKWKDNRSDCLKTSNNIMEALGQLSLIDKADTSANIPTEATWERCVQRYISIYEPEFGGFGLAPKFSQASILNFLFHYYARDKTHPEGKKCLEMCLHTLTKIANGGIHDHVAGGFSRYSVDNRWHVPHFEKMLYDQAQLVVAYTDAFLATKQEFYADVVRDIIKYVKQNLRHESGGFYSAEDADSYPNLNCLSKKEGAFYVWEYDEIKSLINDKKINGIPYFDIFCDYFNVKENGNISRESDPHGEMPHKNILVIYGSKEECATKFGLSVDNFNRVIDACLQILYGARQKRPRPQLDTKILCSWNGLMLSGLAKAGQGLGEKEYVEDALKTASFIKEHLYNATTKTLLHSCYKSDDGFIIQPEQPIKGFLNDYAFLIKGLLDLYEASLDTNWLKWARELQQTQNELYWDSEFGGYFSCSTEDKSVILRLKDDQDGAEPSGNSVSCHNLQRLAAYADKNAAANGGENEKEMAKKLLIAFSKQLVETPTALPEMISALMFYTDSPTQVLISGGCSDPRTLELLRVVRTRLLPGRVLCVTDPASEAPAGMSDILLHRIRTSGDVPTAYVCRRFACSLPVTDVKQLENLLDAAPVIKRN